jgi:hypothetical protein
MTKGWSPEQEAARLKERFAGINRAEFARDHKMPGGAAMIYQHLQGIRPINLEHAIAYARGFRVPLGEISPRLAKVARDALGVSGDDVTPAAPAAPPVDKFAALHRLPENCQEAILTIANTMLIERRPRKRELANANS